MASPDGQGYLIPENPTPEEMACILVFYPDDPFYLRALLGSLSYLGTWTAWERDISKRGRLAASAWKEANECTYDSMGCLTELVAALSGINTTLAAIQAAIENQEISLDSVDLVNAINGVQVAIENQEIALDTGLLLPALTGIQTAIENQEMVCNCGAGGSDEMGTVNVYCGCSCGSGAGTGSDLDDGTAPGGTPIDDALPPVDNEDYDDGSEYSFTQEDACALVHWVLMFWRNTLLGVASGELAISSVFNLVNGMFSGMFGYSVPVPRVVDEILLWFGRLSGASSLAAELDRTYEAIQCRLLQRDVYSDKYSDVCAIIDTWSTNALTKLYAKRFLDILPFRWIYSSNVVASTITGGLVPSWAYARGCPSCVESEPEPQLGHLFPPDGMKWIPVNPLGHSIYSTVLTYEGEGVFSRFVGATETWDFRFTGPFGTGGALPENVRAYAVEVLQHEFMAYYQTNSGYHHLLPDGDYAFDTSKGLIANVLGTPIEVPTGWEMHSISAISYKTLWRVYTGTLRYKLMVLVGDGYPYSEWVGS